MIRVFDADAKTFESNGIKVLKPLSAQVFKEDNGDYYIEVTDRIAMFPFYGTGNIIVATTPWGEQGFRITEIEKRVSKVWVRAWHLFYDTANYTINNSYVDTHDCNYALDHLNSACDQKTPFSTFSDVEGDNSIRVVRKSFDEAIKGVLEAYGGHLVRDNWNIEINASIGQDRGVVISYGKNLQEMTVNENWSAVCTKILPYTTYNQQDVMLDELYLESDVQYPIPYTRAVSFDNAFPTDPYKNGNDVDDSKYIPALKAWLREQAVEYLKENSVPQVNYKVTAVLQNIADVGDTIVVRNERYGIEVVTHVISVKYDCIRQAYKEIEFGNFTEKLQNLLSSVKSEAKEQVSDALANSSYSQKIEQVSSALWDAMGGHCIKENDRLLCVDSLPVDTAKNVLLINKEGIGLSTTGINGVFNGVLSIDGELDFKNINTMNLVADLIKGGTLKLGGSNNGSFELYDGEGNLIVQEDKKGLTLFTQNGQTVSLNATDGLCGYVNSQRYWWADGKTFHTFKMEAEEVTIASSLRLLKITTDTNDGIGIVAVV